MTRVISCNNILNYLTALRNYTIQTIQINIRAETTSELGVHVINYLKKQGLVLKLNVSWAELMYSVFCFR